MAKRGALIQKMEAYLSYGDDASGDVYAVPGESSFIDYIRASTQLTAIGAETLAQVQARYPGAVRMTMEAFVAAKAERQNTPLRWDPTTRERFDEMLGCLPPIDWRDGAFLVGEASDHCVLTGQPRYQAFRHAVDGYLASSRPMTRKELRAVLQGVPPA